MSTPEQVLNFWIDEVGPQGWYTGGQTLDDTCREIFEATWQNAMQGAYALWLTYPTGTLAYLVLMDQLPRNMFRGSGKAFSSDKYALAAAKVAISRGWDMKIDEPARQFFYLPLMHSENLCDQERAVRLIMTRMPETGADNLQHARAHREVIRRFGRFPTRNDALVRKTSAKEADYVANGGYGETLRALAV